MEYEMNRPRNERKPNWLDLLNLNHVNGLSASLVHNDVIEHTKWMRARAEGQFVGRCRRCGDYLIPEAPEDRGQRTDYEARCRNELRSRVIDGVRQVQGCGHVAAAPGGHLGTRSGRSTRSESF